MPTRCSARLSKSIFAAQSAYFEDAVRISLVFGECRRQELQNLGYKSNSVHNHVWPIECTPSSQIMFNTHSSSKDLTYFDIRLKSRGLKNTILVQGNEAEVENIPIEGHVKLLTKQDLHIKKVKLVLTGEYVVDYYNNSTDPLCTGQVTERNCVLKVVWPNLLCSANGELQYGDYGDSIIKYKKAESAKHSAVNSSIDLKSFGKENSPKPGSAPKRPGFSSTKSLPHLFKKEESSIIKIPRSGVDGTPYPSNGNPTSESHSFLLPNGNYSMPFHIYLPSNVPETIEGLSIGKIRYKLECLVERGRFERAFKKSRYFRICRTLHHTSMNLTDSIEFNNTWPEKIEFNLTLPHKGVALGSKVHIKLTIVPLTKGLSFKSMYGEVVQHAHLTGMWGKSPEFETVTEKQKMTLHQADIHDDHWVIKSTMMAPSSLRKITQTCTLKNEIISVRHRIRIMIHIRNADGHVSELRANLPVVLYLNPHHGHTTTSPLEVDAAGNFIDISEEEVEVFPKKKPESPTEESSDEEQSQSDLEGSAPPEYTKHTDDIIYDYLSARTPLEQLRGNGGSATPLDSYFDVPIKAKSTGTSPMLDLNALLKIPGYEEAVDEDSDDIGNEPAPVYQPGSTPDGSFNSSPTCQLRSTSAPSSLSRHLSFPQKKRPLFKKKEHK